MRADFVERKPTSAGKIQKVVATVQRNPEVNRELEQLLDGMAQLDTPDLAHLLSQASILLARRKAPSLPAREAELLDEINRGVPTDVQRRYAELDAALRAETISAPEHQELLALIDRIELADAERLHHLVELAQLRGVSLRELTNQLGIHPPPPHV